MKQIGLWVTSAVLALGALASHPAHADDEEGEQKVSIDQLPTQTRATVQQAMQGGTLHELERVSDDGRLYEAEIKKGDTKEVIYVDSSGKIVGRHTTKK